MFPDAVPRHWSAWYGFCTLPRGGPGQPPSPSPQRSWHSRGTYPVLQEQCVSRDTCVSDSLLRSAWPWRPRLGRERSCSLRGGVTRHTEGTDARLHCSGLCDLCQALSLSPLRGTCSQTATELGDCAWRARTSLAHSKHPRAELALPVSTFPEAGKASKAGSCRGFLSGRVFPYFSCRASASDRLSEGKDSKTQPSR